MYLHVNAPGNCAKGTVGGGGVRRGLDFVYKNKKFLAKIYLLFI